MHFASGKYKDITITVGDEDDYTCIGGNSVVITMTEDEQRRFSSWIYKNKIRSFVHQEDAYRIERVNVGIGEWEYVIHYCGEYYATAPSEEIARDIVRRAIT